MLAQLLLELLTVAISLPPEGLALVGALIDLLVPDEFGTRRLTGFLRSFTMGATPLRPSPTWGFPFPTDPATTPLGNAYPPTLGCG